MASLNRDHDSARNAAAASRVRRRWAVACESLGVTKAREEAWWLLIEAGYGEAHRHYHTLVHIDAMLALASEHGDVLRDSVAVDLAIIFHDIVYDAVKGGGGRNERESAQRFVEFAEGCTGLPKDRVAKVVRWIALTWTHKCEDIDGDGRLFMDFDMAILGSGPIEYARYARNVRREYAHVNWLFWRLGRSQFLVGSTSTKVFATARFAPREAAARANARAEARKLRLELLAAGCGAIASLVVGSRVMFSYLQLHGAVAPTACPLTSDTAQ